MSSYLCFFKNLERIKYQLSYFSEKIPAYRSLHNHISNRINSSKVENLLDLFPITDKEYLINKKEELFEINIDFCTLFSETSGTTGSAPLVTPRSGEELRWNSQNIAFAFKQYLNKGLDKVAIINPGIMSPFMEASCLALMQLGIPFIRIFPIPKICDYSRIVRVLRDYKITTIMTTPTLAYKILYERNNLSNNNWSINKLLLTGELITKASLSNISNILNGEANVFVYGSSEAATVMFGCEEGHYHPYLDDFIYELHPIPDFSGVSQQIYYELVITWLNSGIRPLIRYNTHDAFTYGSECPCGRSGIWFQAEGRFVNSPLDIDKAKQLDEVVFNLPTNVYHYSLSFQQSTEKIDLIISPQASDELKNNCINILQEWYFKSSGKSIEVDINSSSNCFYEFSPATKSRRIISD